MGTYSLTVTAPGFNTFTSTGNVLEIGSSIAINAKMTVGSTEIKVEVHSEGLALQTQDASFKQTIDGKELTEMPLNGRHMTDLISLVGGTQSATPGDAAGSKYPSQTTGISIAGAQGNAVSYRLDGGDNNDYMGGGNAPLPFPDAIGQFSVETAALGAQGGTQAGGLVNIVTKSGTNTYHGSAFEFIRNNFIDAENFFSTSKDTLHQNQYGGTFGGPVRIPKLYNGKDGLFFFAAFQHSYSSSASSTQNAYVPTAANLAGDWSQTDPAPTSSGGTGVANACGPVQQLYDPITGALLPGNKYNRTIANGSQVELSRLASRIVESERQTGHTRLAEELDAILKRSRSRERGPVAVDSGERQLKELPTSRRHGESLVSIFSAESLEHHMVLPPGTEERFARIEKEFAARDRLGQFGLRPRKTILLYGPPGCGKSLGAKRLAWKTGLPLMMVRFDALLSSYFGESATNLRAVFSAAQERPCVLFLVS